MRYITKVEKARPHMVELTDSEFHIVSIEHSVDPIITYLEVAEKTKRHVVLLNEEELNSVWPNKEYTL